jgi:hypothetical protein
MATDAELEVLRHSVDLVSYISQHVQLTKRGNEYRGLCIFHDDHTPSLNVVPSRQIWNCFSCNEHLVHGSDVFGFVRSLYGCTFPEAVLKLQNGNGAGDAKPIIRPPLKKRPPHELLVPPEGSMPDMERGDMGKPLKYWTITTLDGRPFMYEARYVALSGPTKETRPFSYGRYSPSDPPRWECRWPEKDRPFYGLDQLGARPNDQVMIHEAAKKAEAAAELFPRLVHLGFVGGCNAVANTDLSVLKGRRLVMLPDNDRVGVEAMQGLCRLAMAIGAKQVSMIDPSTQPDGSPSPEGWDVADATDWTPVIALAWAKARKKDPQNIPRNIPNAAPQVPDGTDTRRRTDTRPADSAGAAPNAAPEPGPVNPSVAPATPEPAQEAAPDKSERAQPHPKGNGGAMPLVTAQPLTWDGLNLILGSKGEIKACEHNAKELMAGAKQYDCLHFDKFLYRTRLGERDWSDADDRDAVVWLQSAHRVSGFTLNQARTAAMALAHARQHDSLFEFVMGLPEWDGVPRIETAFIEAWGTPDTLLTRAASRNFFIALHARAVKPGAQVDNLWAIEGPQGKLKSASLRALGEHFHAEITAQIGTADFLRELRGIWIAELSELDSLRGREASTVKRLLSAPSDRFVEKFEKHATAYPRRAVAVATTNEATYWQDSTGARRLIPVSVRDIRLDLIVANRLHWFAEARHAYQTGAEWWRFPDSAALEQEERQAVDPWEDTLKDAIQNGQQDQDGYARPWPTGWVASAIILRDWLRVAPSMQGKASSSRLGHVMRRLGFEPRRNNTGEERGWAPIGWRWGDDEPNELPSEPSDK